MGMTAAASGDGQQPIVSDPFAVSLALPGLNYPNQSGGEYATDPDLEAAQLSCESLKTGASHREGLSSSDSPLERSGFELAVPREKWAARISSTRRRRRAKRLMAGSVKALFPAPGAAILNAADGPDSAPLSHL